MLKPLNIDLPQSTWVWGLNKSASAYTRAQLQPAGAGMLFSSNRGLRLAVSEWRAERILRSRAQTVRTGLMQTDRPRCRPLMSPLVLTWKKQCSPKAGFFATHTHIQVEREAAQEKTNGGRERVRKNLKHEMRGESTMTKGKRGWWKL